jgi:hypothetical protein
MQYLPINDFGHGYSFETVRELINAIDELAEKNQAFSAVFLIDLLYDLFDEEFSSDEMNSNTEEL